MPFDDDDLKRLKEKLLNPVHHYDLAGSFTWTGSRISALLARLEAAERVAERFAVLIPIATEAEEIAKISTIELDQRFHRVMIAKNDVEAWRKSCGKDGV